MIGAQGHDVIALAHFLVEKVEQVLDDQVGTQRDVEHFLRIGPEAMADKIVGRKTDAEQVRHIALAEFLRDDGRFREIEQQFVAPGRIFDSGNARRRMRKGPALLVGIAFEFDVVGAAELDVIEIGPQTVPGSADPGVDLFAGVELGDPAMRPQGRRGTS